jgi:ABC-type phosphate transport system permease subunit
LAKKFNIRAILSLLLELAGLVAIVYGFWLIFPFLGFIVGGIAAILVGLAVDPPITGKSGVNR